MEPLRTPAVERYADPQQDKSFDNRQHYSSRNATTGSLPASLRP